jgi:hypothetical protein
VSLDVEVVVAGPVGDLMRSVLPSLLLGVEVEPATDTVLVQRSSVSAGGARQEQPADAADVALAMDGGDGSVDWRRITAR